ncbi:MAG TPA: class I SAM-dependent methyltransferase [Fibrobacteraceae bacterium]|nr:class I SAM-dependent methyltransferase [Fibrobacteraceae bacterium]
MTAQCPVCQAEGLELVYEGPIRSGGADSGFEEGFRVLRCPKCAIVFLDPFPESLEEYYSEKSYWENHHGALDIEKLHRKLDPEQFRWFYEIGPAFLRGMSIVDFGCGAGLFLDAAKSVAASTAGVDKAGYFRGHLQRQGHQFFQDPSEIGDESVDTVVSFDTLEHIPTPKEFLKQMHRVLKRGGHCFVGVPNFHDFLTQLVPKYLPFFFHRSHLFYYEAQTLSKLMTDVGFVICDVIFVHKYDLENCIVWARDGRGQGNQGSNLFDRHTELAFRQQIERQGISSHFLVHAQKA